MLGSTFIPQTLLPLRPEQRQGSGSRNKHLKMNLQSAVRKRLTLGDTVVRKCLTLGDTVVATIPAPPEL